MPPLELSQKLNRFSKGDDILADKRPAEVLCEYDNRIVCVHTDRLPYEFRSYPYYLLEKV